MKKKIIPKNGFGIRIRNVSDDDAGSCNGSPLESNLTRKWLYLRRKRLYLTVLQNIIIYIETLLNTQ